MKLNLFGGIAEAGSNVSGYSNHIAQLARAFIKSGVDLGIESNINQSNRRMVDADLVPCLSKDYHEETTLAIVQPEIWPIKLSDRPKKFFGYLVFEGSNICYGWKHLLFKHKDRIDKIIVPSTHVLEAMGKPELYGNIPVEVIPEGVNTKVFKPLDGIPKNKEFEFLFMGGWAKGPNDRKGLDIALQAFVEEFKHDEPVMFTAKINVAYAPMEKIRHDLLALGFDETNKHLPKMRFIFDTVTEEQQSVLYNTADCFVMPTKAEGFGLTIAEAMACGLPTIATNYGGHTDFLSDRVGYLIDIERMEKATDPFPMYWDAEWAIPSKDHLRKLMRHVYENQKEAKDKGKKAAKLMKKYSWKNSAEKLIKTCFQ